jgi:hypothetical protein
MASSGFESDHGFGSVCSSVNNSRLNSPDRDVSLLYLNYF